MRRHIVKHTAGVMAPITFSIVHNASLINNNEVVFPVVLQSLWLYIVSAIPRITRTRNARTSQTRKHTDTRARPGNRLETNGFSFNVKRYHYTLNDRLLKVNVDIINVKITLVKPIIIM